MTAQVEAKPRGQGYSRQATLIMRIFDYKTIPRGSPSNQEVEPAQPHSPKIPILRIALGKRLSRQPSESRDFFLLMRVFCRITFDKFLEIPKIYISLETLWVL